MKKKLLAGLTTGFFLCVMTSTAMATSITSSGYFDNATGEGAVVTGEGTPFFTWGTGAGGSGPNSLEFIGGNCSIDLSSDQDKKFDLGTIQYSNGSVFSWTDADSVDLFITLSTGSGPDLNFDFELLLENTPYSEDPDESADFVRIVSATSEALFSEEGQPYVMTLEFGKISTPGGFTSFDEFHVFEGATASTCLIGSISPAVAPVPEPATMLLFGTGLAGLAGYRNRRKNKA